LKIEKKIALAWIRTTVLHLATQRTIHNNIIVTRIKLQMLKINTDFRSQIWVGKVSITEIICVENMKPQQLYVHSTTHKRKHTKNTYFWLEKNFRNLSLVCSLYKPTVRSSFGQPTQTFKLSKYILRLKLA